MIETKPASTVADSLNWIVIVALVATPAAPPAGVVETTAGSGWFRGLGAPVVKSELLLSVSAGGAPPRIAAVMLLSVAVGPAPSKQLAAEPYPTKSTTAVAAGQPIAIEVWLLTSATFPAVALIAMLPVASAIGRLVAPPVPAASCTR